MAAWRDRGRLRIFLNSRDRLICLDAVTGRPVDSFGTRGVVTLSENLVNRGASTMIDGVPLTRPPYGSLVAMDLDAGTIAWRVPVGDWPELRAAEPLRGVALPDRLGAVGPPGAIVTRGGLVFVGGNDFGISAFDKASGRELWRHVLPRQATATPMTYRGPSGRQFVVIATGRGDDAALVAFALDR